MRLQGAGARGRMRAQGAGAICFFDAAHITAKTNKQGVGAGAGAGRRKRRRRARVQGADAGAGRRKQGGARVVWRCVVWFAAASVAGRKGVDVERRALASVVSVAPWLQCAVIAYQRMSGNARCESVLIEMPLVHARPSGEHGLAGLELGLVWFGSCGYTDAPHHAPATDRPSDASDTLSGLSRGQEIFPNFRNNAVPSACADAHTGTAPAQVGATKAQ